MGITLDSPLTQQDITSPWNGKPSYSPPPNTRDGIAIKGGLMESIPQNINANASTSTTNIFRVLGSVIIYRLYAGVNQPLSSNITDVSYDLWDGTVSTAITLAGAEAVNISAAPVGSVIAKTGANTASLAYFSSAAGVYNENAVANTLPFKPFLVVQKNGVDTFIRFTYTTTDTPASGELVHELLWVPLGQGGVVMI